MCEAFSGATYDDDTKTYTFPDAADSWAGFANKDTSIYPMKLGGGATITFDASVPSGQDADIRFRFERLPYPNHEPAFDSNAITVSGATETTYTINVGAQNATNTYSSFLMYLNTRNIPVVVKNINVVPGS